jgi:hypothetical protein
MGLHVYSLPHKLHLSFSRTTRNVHILSVTVRKGEYAWDSFSFNHTHARNPWTTSYGLGWVTPERARIAPASGTNNTALSSLSRYLRCVAARPGADHTPAR